LRQSLGELAPEHEDNVRVSAQRAEQRRQQEELHRAALASYDHRAYSRGMSLLLGSSLLFFLTLAALIFF
jgi:hypothetical protein